MNAAMAGVMLVASFARFNAPIVVSSEGRPLSRPFGRRDLSAMVESARKRRGVQVVRKSSC